MGEQQQKHRYILVLSYGDSHPTIQMIATKKELFKSLENSGAYFAIFEDGELLYNSDEIQVSQEIPF